MQSMTGYGSAETENYRIDIRSLNHRFLDINIKLPHQLFSIEPEIRNILRKTFSRGKFDVIITGLNKHFKGHYINHEAVLSMYKELLDISLRLRLERPSISDLLNLKDFMSSQTTDDDLHNVLKGVNVALKSLKEMRLLEGSALCTEISSYLSACSKIVEKIHHSSLQSLISLKTRLKDKITALAEDIVDESRLVQEIAILVQKADISEELDRLGSHIKQTSQYLTSEDVNGKKLDFLFQEMAREANTISAKAAETEIINLSVELRLLIEKMREQTQNIQ